MKNRIWSLMWIFNMLFLMACQSDQATTVIPKVIEKPAPISAVHPSDTKVKDESKAIEETENKEGESVEAEKIATAAQLAQEEAEKLKEEERRAARRKKRAEKREAEKLKQQEIEAENQRLAEEAANKQAGKLQFSDRSHDFGRIQEGDTLRHEFSFFNIGAEPIVITNIKASCGCTKTKFPEEPIMPGEKGVIGVTFDSKGKLGRQKPFISVTTNGIPQVYSLYLEGEVDTERL